MQVAGLACENGVADGCDATVFDVTGELTGACVRVRDLLDGGQFHGNTRPPRKVSRLKTKAKTASAAIKTIFRYSSQGCQNR